MRWTDLPPTSPVQSLAAWRASHGVAGGAFVADATPHVLVAPAARRRALHHVGDSMLERGGLLVGVPVAERAGGAPILLVHVVDAVAGVDDDATSLSLRLDASVWSRANASLGAGETVVGWFHSHPGLGAFFSDTDRRTQAAFFAHAFSVGWVIDPLRGEEAWFVGAGAVPVAARIVAA